MGVCAFANTRIHSIFMQMWRLMFVCSNESCQHGNDVALICARCKKPLPVLKEMASFLLVWHRATVDLRMAYKR
eukprot:14626028-Alexandrium_andersonii.AAC.1